MLTHAAVWLIKIVYALLDKPTLKYLMRELHPKVSDKWKDIGTELEVDDEQLIQIRTKYPEDNQKCLRETLRE